MAADPQVEIIADSISEDGDRLTSVQVTMHRFPLAEVNTHRALCLAGDSVLDFDLPAGTTNGYRRKFSMRLDDFVEKWHNGAAPRPNKRRKDGTQGTNRQPVRDRLAGMRIRQLNEVTGLVQTSTVLNCWGSGTKSVYEVRAGRHRVAGSRDHRVFTPQGWRTIGDLLPGDEIVISRWGKKDEDVLDPNRLQKIGGVWRSQWQRVKRAEMIDRYGGCTKCGDTDRLQVHHLIPVHVDPSLAFSDENVTLLCYGCHDAQHKSQGWQGGTYLYGDTVVIQEVVYRGEEMTYDLEIAGEFPNFLANGVVVHNSRNSASSRAIPAQKQLDRFTDDPWFPLEWPREQSGMQGGSFLEGEDLVAAQRLFHDVHTWTSFLVRQYLDDHSEPDERLHKSLINRLMEWGQQHIVLLTGTTWDGFFAQRCSPLAQPEFRIPAEMIFDAREKSRPVELGPLDWHTPYIRPDEEFPSKLVKCQVSAARCARTSYVTQQGIRDAQEDMNLFTRLATADPMHASPLEHVARPSRSNDAYATIENFEGEITGSVRVPLLGNFLGYRQFRHMVTGSF